MTPEPDGLRELIESERLRFGVPGVAVGIVRDGEVVFTAGAGTRQAGDDLPVTDRTLFAIGSCTKAFTAGILATLVDEGAVSWDRPVRDYLPYFELADPVAAAQATITDLLAHRTGVPRHDLAWFERQDLSRADLIRRLRHLAPSTGFRAAWQYNNLMYVAAGQVAAEVTGGSWEDALAGRLLGPLGMTRTNMSVSRMPGADDVSLAHGTDGGRARPIPYRSLDLVAAVGGINSCVRDLTGWLSLNITGTAGSGPPVLSARALRRLHAPAMAMPATTARDEHPDIWPEARTGAYGLGWFLGSYRQHVLVHHAGNIDGFSAMVSFLPERGVGVIVLANLSETPLPTVLTYTVYDRILGLGGLPWGERFGELGTARSAGAAGVASHRETTAAGVPPAHPLESYRGRYVHPGYGDLTIRMAGDALAADLNTLPLVLRHRHYEVWEAESPIAPLGMPVHFATGYDGTVDAVSVVLEPAIGPICFQRAPQAGPSSARHDQITGSYRLGPLRLDIIAGGETGLTLTITGQPPYPIYCHNGLRYRIATLPGARVEAVPGADGRAGAIVADPWGRFERAEDEPR